MGGIHPTHPRERGRQRGEEEVWEGGSKRADKALQYFSKATSILQG